MTTIQAAPPSDFGLVARAALRIVPVLVVSFLWTVTMTVPRVLSRLEAVGAMIPTDLVEGVFFYGFFVVAMIVQALTVVAMLVAVVVACVKLDRFWEGLVAGGALLGGLIAIQLGATMYVGG